MKKRVVITGVGVLTGNAKGRQGFWQALKKGQIGYAPISLFNTDNFLVKEAAEVKDFNPKFYMGEKGLRNLDRSTKLLVSAAMLARDDSGLRITGDNTDEIGVAVGTTLGNLGSVVEFDEVLLKEGLRGTSPGLFPNTVMNSAPSQVSIWLNIQGFNTTLSNGFTASLDAMHYAHDFIQSGRSKVVFAGGVEDLSFATFWGFYTAGYLSGAPGFTKVLSPLAPPGLGEPFFNGPFDRRRNGATLGEAACLLVMEEYDHAKSRKAKMWGEVLSFGAAFDPARSHQLNPRATGLKRAMMQALDRAYLAPADMDGIFANANSTEAMDKVEARAIKDVFGEFSRRVPVTAIKSMVGETHSVSGSLAAVAALGAMQEGFIPPTVNCSEPDPACDVNIVAGHAAAARVKRAMVVNFSPNGNNTCLVLGRVEP